MSGSPSEATLEILLVDDSATYRMILTRAVKGWPRGNLLGSAGDGEAALKIIAEKKPDLVLLDVSMPVLDGIETLKRIRARWSDVDVVMCSGIDASQTGLTMQALSLGALDFLPKPQGDNPAESFAALSMALYPLLDLALNRKTQRLARGSNLARSAPIAPAVPAAPSVPAFRSSLGLAPAVSEPSLRPRSGGLPPVPVRRAPVAPPPVVPAAPLAPAAQPFAASGRRPPGRIDVLVVGVSTGGPNALHVFIPKLPADLPFPVLCVQHMPPLFTASLAERLDRDSALGVEEGVEGRKLENGRMYIAPGGHHMVVARASDGRLQIRLSDAAPVNSCRPAVDVLFRSVEEVVGGGVVSVILTGMGSDGASGVRGLRAKGAWNIAQDEASSVVWGMPGAVVQQGLADEILPLDRIADRIAELARRGGAR
jgi:two-component system chemotaxis response regulator CheB